MTLSLSLPPVRFRPLNRPPNLYSVGQLVSFNGHTGKVMSYIDGETVRVSFGQGRIKKIKEEDLQEFIPWWSDKD